MNDFQDKPKRKNQARNPYVFLGAGLVIGMFFTALIAGALIYYLQEEAASKTTAVEPVALMPTVTPILAASVNATQAPQFDMQSVQPTVIAPRVQAVAASPDGRYLATIDVENGESIITLHELRVERNLYGEQTVLHREAAFFEELVFSPDGSKLVASINGGIALLFDVENKELLERYPNIGGAAFNEDGSLLALVGAPNGIRVIDMDNFILRADRIDIDAAYQVGAVAINSQDKLAIAYDGRVEVYDLDNLREEPDEYTISLNFVGDIAFHPSGDYLAMSGDGRVQVLDLTNNSRTDYNIGTQRIHALAFSPNGEWLAIGGGESGYGESQLFAFRWADSEVLPPDPLYYQPVRLTGHEHTIMDVAFTHDGYLLSASWDGSVRLWDLNRREEISELRL